MATKPKPIPGIFHLGDGAHLTVKSSTVVEMRDHLKLMVADNKSVDLDVVIRADFEKIPPNYHHLFMQMMSVRYGGIVNIWDNSHPFSKPVEKKKWWQFWK